MEHTTKKTTEKPKTGSKIDKSTIETIDPILYKAGIKNGLPLSDIKFCGAIIKGDKQGKAYKEHIAKPTTTERTSIDVKASDKLRNIKIQETLKDVLVSEKITTKSIVKKHLEIQNKALKAKDFTNARETNRDFMKLNGMLEQKEKDKGNTYIQNNIIDTNAIDKLLKLDNG